MTTTNTTETIPDIAREMRVKSEMAYAGQTGYPECWRDQIEPDDVDDWADRIEAARDRENAAMRKALEACSDELYGILGLSYMDDRRIASLRQTVRAALSAPADKAE